MIRVATIAALAIALSPIAARAAGCPNDGYVFVGQPQANAGQKLIAYFPEGRGMNSPLVFEGWTGRTMDWRLKAEFVCSNGDVTCTVLVPLKSGDKAEGVETSIMDGDAPLYMTFGGLGQDLARLQRVSDTLPAFEGKAAPMDSLELPNVWKVTGCKR